MRVPFAPSMATETGDADAEYRAVRTRVVVSQLLWMTGYSLTTGPFLSYFGQDLGATPRMTALLLIIPETAGIAGLLTRRSIRFLGGRKQVWIASSLLARAASLGIPLAAIPSIWSASFDPLQLMAGSLVLSHAAQAISYVAYVSWLSDAVPSARWGRFFAARNIAEIAVLMIVPLLGGYLRDWWKIQFPPSELRWVYVLAYGCGFMLMLTSMVPLMAIAERRASAAEMEVSELRRLRQIVRNRSMRLLLIHGWWLALANGLTQAAFYHYLKGTLNLGLGTTYLLNDVMHAVAIPVSWATGIIVDRRGNKRPMIVGVLVSGSSLIFWLLATPAQWWWLFIAYACWGAFPAVNIAGRNLVLELSPRHDNAAAMALFRQVGGLLAGVSGLFGGLWLSRLQQVGFVLEMGEWRLGGFQILFLTSLCGRLTAALWLMPIRGRRLVENNVVDTVTAATPACAADTSD